MNAASFAWCSPSRYIARVPSDRSWMLTVVWAPSSIHSSRSSGYRYRSAAEYGLGTNGPMHERRERDGDDGDDRPVAPRFPRR